MTGRYTISLSAKQINALKLDLSLDNELKR
jgi:hypothetical protein